MALTYDSTEDKWNDSITINQQAGSKLTLATNDKYVSGDIEFNIGVRQASGISITGGAPSGSVSTMSGSNITLSDTNNGIAITASGSTSRAAITCSATTAGWVSTSIASADASSTSLTPKTRYATAVAIPSGKTFAVSGEGTANIASSTTLAALTNSGTITSLSNSGTITSLENTGTITGLGNASGKTIATLTNKGTITTLNNTGTITVKSTTTTAGTVKVNAYPASGSTLDGEKTIISSGRWQCTPTFNGAGTYYGKVTIQEVGTITLSGGAPSGAVNEITGTNVGVSNTDNGIYVDATGTTSRAAISCTAASIGWINTTSIASAAASSAVNLTSKRKYITSISVPPGKNFSISLQNNSSTDSSILDLSMGRNRKVGIDTYDATGVQVIIASSLSNGPPGERTVVTNGKLIAATLTFTAGAITNKEADISTSNNVTLSSTTNNSGVSILCRGKAGCAASTYSNTEGWLVAHSSTSTGKTTSQTTWTGETYYINGVTLVKPSSGTRTFTITVPNGGSNTITLTFTVDSSGNTVIT